MISLLQKETLLYAFLSSSTAEAMGHVWLKDIIDLFLQYFPSGQMRASYQKGGRKAIVQDHALTDRSIS